jgi:DNA-binding response OmpR family regulator
MTQHVLIIDDDLRLADMVKQYLERSGYTCEHAESGEAGLAAIQSRAPDAVLLDLMLPSIDGLEVCRRIRALQPPAHQLPILMLTAKGDPMDRIVGLEMGADDYLPKPFEPREMLARLRAILRRQHHPSGTTDADSAALVFGTLVIDPDAREVRVKGKLVDLTSYQFDVLMAMAQRAGRVLSRDQIMESVRGKELEAFDRSIDVHIGRIRQAIEEDTKAPKRILTVRGVGYVFARQQD